jgi:hypothetical protein
LRFGSLCINVIPLQSMNQGINPTQLPSPENTIIGTATTVTIDDIIAAEGEQHGHRQSELAQHINVHYERTFRVISKSLGSANL